jgi:hypothetical protein
LRTAGPALAALLIAGNAHAALIGVTTSFPDTTLQANPTIIYKHTGVSSTVGELTVITTAAALTAASGGNSVTQNYAGDTPPQDLMLTIDVNNSTGAFVSGAVSVALGDSPTAARWSWAGNVTQFGFVDPTKSSSGTIFDARWHMNADTYQNMPANMSQFVTGSLAGRNGALDLLSTAAWGGTAAGKANFGNDWIYGSTPGSVSTVFTTGISNPILVTSTISSDLWVTPVPLPAAAWLLLSGLGLFGLVPGARRTAQAGLV